MPETATSGPEQLQSQLSESERAGMTDMWAVYDRHYEEIAGRLLEDLSGNPEVAPLVNQVSDQVRQEQSRISRELMNRAILEDDWAPYLENLRAQGEAYADLGLPFAAWVKVVAAFRRLLRPHLLDEYGLDLPRFLDALEGMTRVLDIALAEIAEAYFSRKEHIISQQDRALREMSTSRAVLTSVADGVVTTDPEGLVTAINPAMERLSGWSAGEAVGKPYHEVHPLLDRRGEHIPPAERFLARAIRSGQIVTGQGYELTMLARDGRRVPVAITAAPIVDDEGKLVGGVDVIRDVSHEREVDLMKSALVSTVSHELRTPLTMIEGFSELLLTRDLDPERARQAAEQIHDSALRLDRLVGDLLSVSRIESGSIQARREPVHLPTVVEEVATTFGSERTIRMELDGVGQVIGDDDMVHRILTNLVSNAVKYSDDAVTVAARRDQTSASVSVSDTGIGMSSKDLSRLFDKFFRADRPEVRNARGTGLGLYITRNLVELQGGRIFVESTPGEGTTFTFTLPLPAGKEGA